MALVFSDRAFAEGSVLIGMYGKVVYFFLRCTDVLWYFLWRFESVVLLCVGLYCNSLREAIFDTQILCWPRLFGQTHCYFTKVFRCYHVVVTYVQLCLFCIILLYLCMRGWCHFGLYWFSFVLLPCCRYMLHYIMVLFIVYFFVFGQCHSVMLILSHCIFFFFFFSCLIVLFIMYVHHISPWFCSFIFWLKIFFFFSFNACLRTNKFFKGGGSVVNHGSHTLFT